MQFVIIFALIVSIFAVMFALQNPNIVTLHFIIWDFEQPLALFLLIAIAVGALIISILTVPGWIRNRQLRSKHRKEVAELEDNLSKYRSNLIDAQNSNKDLRQKILEIEEAKEKLEQAQVKAEEEINDLHTALNKADLSTQEAEQAKKEAAARAAAEAAAMRYHTVRSGDTLSGIAKRYRTTVKRICQLPAPPKPDDAADAVALAICHARSTTSLLFRGDQEECSTI